MSTPRRPWTDAELAVLRRNYPHFPTAQIAKQLGRTVSQVYQAADRHGLRKSEAYLASDAACRLRRGDNVGAEHRFKPGQQPWNTGLHFVAGGRSAETQFKPGRPASEARNYAPIGSLRVNADGYLDRKVTDDPTLNPARRWVAVHRLVWEAAHGPLPAGHAVCFLPGRKTTDPALITLDAVELVTRAELMRRNTVHRYGPEIAHLHQLRGAITRQINQRAKEDA